MFLTGKQTFCQLIDWRMLALFSCLAANPVFSQTAYEAESARLAGGAYADNCPTCSGGRQVRNIGGENGGTVTFNRVRVPQAGLWPVTVLYNVGDDRSFAITVNDDWRTDLIFYRTVQRGKEADSSRTILLPLQAGDNTIEFGMAEENAPDLDAIVIGTAPADSESISGVIEKPDGTPLAGVAVGLSGLFSQAKTVTDMAGHYRFPFLPKADFYVRPVSPGKPLVPFEIHCPATVTNRVRADFMVRGPAVGKRNKAVMALGKWRIEYDLATGCADIYSGERLFISHAFAVARVPATVTSMDYPSRQIVRNEVADGFGKGVKFTVTSCGENGRGMIQTFQLYDQADFFLTAVAVTAPGGVRCNYLSPLTSQATAEFLPAGENQVLAVPFDNDKWTRYDAMPFGREVTSHEVSALYDNVSRRGLVIGSITHDVWKTGVRLETSAKAVTGLEVFGGLTANGTRDVLPHGTVCGKTVRSPEIFAGNFADWRDGLEAYARANAVLAPRRPWEGGVPFGWNSWGKLQKKVSYAKAVQVSDFMARELPVFTNNGVAYLGLDAGWTRFKDAELKQFVEHCRGNHQEAGIYFAPFSLWHNADETPVAGTDYKYQDIFLRANGEKQTIDGGTALDPTHPGTRKLIADTIARFKAAGFKYLKVDFLTHGSLEADHFFDPAVTTGMQAYNEGMRFVDECVGPDMYLNEAISPLLPAQYANSRRISCDTFGGISEVGYELNSLTYGWWLAGVYDFNDADHMVLDGYSEGENRARVTSATITGVFIAGDDFSDAGSRAGKERAKKYLNNAEVDALVRARHVFRPVEWSVSNQAANVFSCEDGKSLYLAVFNFTPTNRSVTVDLGRLGFQSKGPFQVKELWSGATAEMTGPLAIRMGAKDAGIYQVATRPGD